MERIIEINKCRLCDSKNIKNIWNFGLSPIANRYKNQEDLDKDELQFPLEVFRCNECGSVQLKHEIDPNILFHNYSYESPPNLNKHFEEYANHTFKLLELKKEDLVIGIGGNIGQLEKHYQNLGCKVINIEPAVNIAEKSKNNGINTINEFFNIKLAKRIVEENGYAKLVTGNNVFAHLKNVNEIVEGIRILLDNDGYFVFECCHLLKMLNNKDLGQVYFEHLFYHYIFPLIRFFSKHDFELFHVEHSLIQMGSFRAYVRRKGNNNLVFLDNTVEKVLEDEERAGLNNDFVYESFINDINKIKSQLLNSLKGLKTDSICLYGVPAKVVILIKYFELESYIKFAVEESSLKINKFIPGTRIQIKSREDWIKENPKYTILGAYNFEKDIKEKNREYNGWWIHPLNLEFS